MTHPRQHLLSLVYAFLNDLSHDAVSFPWVGKTKEMLDPIYEALEKVELYLEDLVEGVAE